METRKDKICSSMAYDNRPFILISNDDGYEAKGIRALVSMVEGLGDILVCAPDTEIGRAHV